MNEIFRTRLTRLMILHFISFHFNKILYLFFLNNRYFKLNILLTKMISHIQLSLLLNIFLFHFNKALNSVSCSLKVCIVIGYFNNLHISSYYLINILTTILIQLCRIFRARHKNWLRFSLLETSLYWDFERVSVQNLD